MTGLGHMYNICCIVAYITVTNVPIKMKWLRIINRSVKTFTTMNRTAPLVWFFVIINQTIWRIMASTGLRIRRSITFSGRLILPDRHTSPQPQSLCLRFLDISDLVEGVLTNFEYCHQLFLYWRRVDFAGINTNLSPSEFLFQRYLLSLSLTSLVLKQAPSHEWCARCLLVWRAI